METIKQGRKIENEVWGGVVILNRVLTVGLTKKVASEKFEGGKGACFEDIWEKGIPDRGISQSKCSAAELDLQLQRIPGNLMGLEPSEQILRKGERSDQCGQRGQMLYGSIDYCETVGFFLE